MTLSWHKADNFLMAGDREIKCWSKVRNEINGLRPKKGIPDLVYSLGKDGRKEYPVMPRPFPVGVWKIMGFNDHSELLDNGKPRDGYLFPVFINTNAYALLDIWELDENGFYLKNTHEKTQDYFYGLHYSTSDWTQGCLRIASETDVRWLWDNCRIGDSFIVTE